MTESLLDPQLTALITTILTIVIGIIAAKFKTQHSTAMNALAVTSDKADKFGKAIAKMIAANEDKEITTEEFNGIVSAFKEVLELPAQK